MFSLKNIYIEKEEYYLDWFTELHNLCENERTEQSDVEIFSASTELLDIIKNWSENSWKLLFLRANFLQSDY